MATESLDLYSKYPALRLAATQAQPVGPDLFARNPASSLGYVSTYAPSLLLGLRANSSRRGVLGI